MKRVGSLFSGIGGFDLAAGWMGWTTAWYSEIDPFCCRVMAHHFPEARPLGDITQIDWHQVEPVDILCGGFPCQDLSIAGNRAGLDGARSGLWFEFARAIRHLRPRVVVVENVPGLLTLGMGTVLGDLAGLGYDAEWQVLSAADVGAPHLRKRIWIVAYAHPIRCDGRSGTVAQPHGRRQPSDGGGNHTDPNGERELQPQGGEPDKRGRIGDVGTHVSNPARSGLPEQRGTEPASAGLATPQCRDWWTTEPEVGRMAHGVPDRVAQLAGLGNAIVPACAYHIFQRIRW